MFREIIIAFFETRVVSVPTFCEKVPMFVTIKQIVLTSDRCSRSCASTSIAARYLGSCGLASFLFVNYVFSLIIGFRVLGIVTFILITRLYYHSVPLHNY